MAKTAVDLGDPLQGRGDHALNSADDLLAQLAGEEVDRLLSEADGHPVAARNVDIPPAAPPAPAPAPAAVAPSSTSPASPAPAAKPAAKFDPNEAALDDLFNQLNSAEIPIPPPAAAKVKEKAGPVSEASLDDLFDQLNAAEIAVPGAAPAAPAPAADADAISRAMLGDAPASADAAPSGTPVSAESVEETLAQRAQALIAEARRQNEAEVTAGGAVQPPSAADALAAEMDADDRAHSAALRRMKDAPATAPAADAAEAGADVAVIDEAAVEHAADLDDQAAVDAENVADRVPLIVRLLEWLNAPLSGLPDSVREALGKVALVTTFNSLAVLLYVLIFRR